MSPKLSLLITAAVLLPASTLLAETNVPMPVITMDPVPITLDFIVPGQPHPIELAGLQLTSPSAAVPITPGTKQFHVDSFFDVFTEISTDGGSTFLPAVQSQGAHLVYDGNLSTASHDNVIILSSSVSHFDILSLPNFPGLELRESPSLTSTGQTTLTTNGDGTFRIDSFFDIFTELSLDGGQSWTLGTSNGNNSLHLTGSPEPTSLALLSLSTLPLLLRKRRH